MIDLTGCPARIRSVLRCCALNAVMVVLSAPAFAQGTDSVSAEALFQQGRDLLRQGEAAEACPKLAESQRLEPATGTLLALAMCHEAEGKLASAWAEYVSVRARARAESRPDREQVAQEAAERLRPRLSMLEIRLAPGASKSRDLRILRDEVELGAGAWNTPMPIDGGEHVLVVTADGKEPYTARVNVKSEGDTQVLSIPELRAKPANNTSSVDSSRARRHAWSAWEWAGVGAGGAGVAALAVGGYFFASALGEKADSDGNCRGNLCGPQGFADRTKARSDGDRATWLGVAGGVLVGAGATLFIVGRSSPADRNKAQLRLGVDSAGVGVQFVSTL